jgi:hypothetical protein
MRPEVITCGEETEANQVATTMTLPSQLTSTLVDNIISCWIGNLAYTCTGTNGIELSDTIAAYATYYLALSLHQIYIAETAYWEVGVGE